jgi:hypothetical protein
MVGWLKRFVHSRAEPHASIMKGYTVHMLARRAPYTLAKAFDMRRQNYGEDMAKRGHLTLMSTLLADRKNKPGCGQMSVNISRRNSKELDFYAFPRPFRTYYRAYNKALPQDSKFKRRDRIVFSDILKGTYTHICMLSPTSTTMHSNPTIPPRPRSQDKRSTVANDG